MNPVGNTRYTPLQISPDDIKRALRTFPAGSSGGPDGLTPQHLTDLLLGDEEGKLLNALTNLTNLMLAGKFDTEIISIIYGGRLIDLSKKGGGVRPMAVGYTHQEIGGQMCKYARIERTQQTPSTEASWSGSDRRCRSCNPHNA